MKPETTVIRKWCLDLGPPVEATCQWTENEDDVCLTVFDANSTTNVFKNLFCGRISVQQLQTFADGLDAVLRQIRSMRCE